MPVQLDYDRKRLAEFCQKWHISKLSFFGSVVRPDFGPHSDIDALYIFEDGHAPGWEIVDIVEELEQLLGRKVDFVPEEGINRWIRSRVLREAEVQYGG